MKAARLYDKQDIRLDNVNEPQLPKAGEVLVRIGAVGVCGSDLHTYEDARIGDTGIGNGDKRQHVVITHEEKLVTVILLLLHVIQICYKCFHF